MSYTIGSHESEPVNNQGFGKLPPTRKSQLRKKRESKRSCQEKRRHAWGFDYPKKNSPCVLPRCCGYSSCSAYPCRARWRPRNAWRSGSRTGCCPSILPTASRRRWEVGRCSRTSTSGRCPRRMRVTRDGSRRPTSWRTGRPSPDTLKQRGEWWLCTAKLSY